MKETQVASSSLTPACSRFRKQLLAFFQTSLSAFAMYSATVASEMREFSDSLHALFSYSGRYVV